MGICITCENNQIIKTQINDSISPPSIFISHSKIENSTYLGVPSLSLKSTAITKSITPSMRNSTNYISFHLLKEINLLRINPKNFAIQLQNCLSLIKLNTLNNKYYLYYGPDNNSKIKLKVKKENFIECIDYLSSLDNNILHPLEYSPDLVIPFPNDNPSLALDKEYLKSQIDKIKLKNNDTIVFTEFHYDISPNVFVSIINQIVDNKKVNYHRRNNLLSKTAKYVGITSGKLENNLICFYLVFGNRNNYKN